jgi:hypothetical protein
MISQRTKLNNTPRELVTYPICQRIQFYFN